MYELPNSNTVLARFNRLIQEVLSGDMRRRTFRLWEADILLDIMRCKVSEGSMAGTLRRYQKAVNRQMSAGPNVQPLKLSEYLESLERRHDRTRVKPVVEIRTKARSSPV